MFRFNNVSFASPSSGNNLCYSDYLDFSVNMASNYRIDISFFSNQFLLAIAGGTGFPTNLPLYWAIWDNANPAPNSETTSLSEFISIVPFGNFNATYTTAQPFANSTALLTPVLDPSGSYSLYLWVDYSATNPTLGLMRTYGTWINTYCFESYIPFLS